MSESNTISVIARVYLFTKAQRSTILADLEYTNSKYKSKLALFIDHGQMGFHSTMTSFSENDKLTSGWHLLHWEIGPTSSSSNTLKMHHYQNLKTHKGPETFTKD